MRVRFTHICLLCVAVLAQGEEHHHDLTESNTEPSKDGRNLGGKLGEGQHDDHADHDHSEGEHGHDDHSHEEGHDPGHDNHSHVGHDHDHEGPHHDHEGPHKDPLDTDRATDYKTWVAASGAILVISLCGIFGVLVIPIMQLVFYQHLIQFLIALAVGTLAGDALLHLLPHAFMAKITQGKDNHDHHNHEQHEQAVWLGLVAVVSMIGFFLFEKCVNLLGEWKEARSRRQEEASPSPKEEQRKLRVVREGHVASDKALGERLCKKKYSTYCVQDFDLEKVTFLSEKVSDEERCNASPSCSRRQEEPVAAGQPDLLDTPSSSRALEGVKTVTGYRVGDANSNMVEPDHDTVIISEHEVVHHGHSHAHSHLHSAPGSISSVALMVIFGDGIHNLADGLAIGAAFADGFMSGMSTSVAVLCHELPHEIGDFAMLLKAGMTIKQAVFYNVLSSVLAFMGMVVGLLLGTVNNFAPWIFTATAGIFLYVALVDMMPELSSGHAHPISKDHQHEGHWLEIFLQVLGMACGVSVMLLIALYEHDLKQAFVAGGEGHEGHEGH